MLIGKAVYFVRVVDGPVGKTVESDISYGEISEQGVECFQTALTELITPVLESQAKWGKTPTGHVDDFLAGLRKFGEGLTEAVDSLQSGVELRKPSPEFEQMLDYSRDDFGCKDLKVEAISHFDECLDSWITEVEKLIGDGDTDKNTDSQGPNSELEYWRNRQSRVNSITEQLKTKDCRAVLAVTNQSKSNGGRHLKKWRQLDGQITDAANEAADNVKYLSALEPYTEPLYHGSVQTIIDGLPGLMNSVKMMHTIARYYNTTERMTKLFRKITNQVRRCSCFARPALWDPDQASAGFPAPAPCR